jgi:hypothetical protein
MEHTALENIAIDDEAWIADREEAKNCPSFDVQSLIFRVLGRWKSAGIGYRAIANAQVGSDQSRKLARSLREAEQALFAVATAAFPLLQQGIVGRLEDLMFALLRCRMLIVLPLAKRMAEQDELKRSAEDIAYLIARDARFVDGRAVIDQALASELPSPFKPEEPNA